MTRDIWRLVSLAVLGGCIGHLLGSGVAGALVGLALHGIWQQWLLRQLLAWVRDRKRHAAPEVPGVLQELCREIDFFRDRHKRRKRKLSGYLKQFQAATAALPDGTVVLDARGDIRWANAAAEQYLGVRWPQDAAQRLSNLVRHPDLSAMLDPDSPTDRSIEIPSPTLPEVQLSVRVVPYGEDQRLFVARDVTRLHRLSEVRSEFVANVSHELRTPLTVVRGYLETLSADVERCPPAWRQAFEVMQASAERMGDVIDGLLLLARLEQDDEPRAPEPVDVPEMLGRIYREAQALSGADRHLFSLEVDASLLVTGAAHELHSAFSNILVNAVRYTPERGVIRVRWWEDESGAHFEVADTGIGIPPEQIPRLTERFYRGDRSRARSTGGTGLGLAIVKHVLARHGAALAVTSAVGVGSCFRCDFPRGLVVRRPQQDVDEAAEQVR